MAGTATPGESSDNPVPINVTAMVDIIFCLCIFFFCSFHFRQLEGKMETWLPGEGSDPAKPAPRYFLEEIRVFLRAGAAARDGVLAVERRVGSRVVRSDAELRAVLREAAAAYARAGGAEPPLIVDAEPGVPWAEVVRVLDLACIEGLRRLEFASPRG